MIGSMHLPENDPRQVFGTVGDAMTHDVVTVTPETTVAEAIASLERRGIGGAAVVQDHRIVGVVVRSDLAAPRPHAASTGPFLRPAAHRGDWTVGDVMSPSPVTATADEPLADAIERMDGAVVDHLPVVGPQGEIVGWLTTRDVVHRIAATLDLHDHPSTRRPFLVRD